MANLPARLAPNQIKVLVARTVFINLVGGSICAGFAFMLNLALSSIMTIWFANNCPGVYYLICGFVASLPCLFGGTEIIHHGSGLRSDQIAQRVKIGLVVALCLWLPVAIYFFLQLNDFYSRPWLINRSLELPHLILLSVGLLILGQAIGVVRASRQGLAALVPFSGDQFSQLAARLEGETKPLPPNKVTAVVIRTAVINIFCSIPIAGMWFCLFVRPDFPGAFFSALICVLLGRGAAGLAQGPLSPYTYRKIKLSVISSCIMLSPLFCWLLNYLFQISTGRQFGFIRIPELAIAAMMLFLLGQIWKVYSTKCALTNLEATSKIESNSSV